MKVVPQPINLDQHAAPLQLSNMVYEDKTQSVAYSFCVFHCRASALFIRAAIFEIQLGGSEESDFLSSKSYLWMKHPTWKFKYKLNAA